MCNPCLHVGQGPKRPNDRYQALQHPPSHATRLAPGDPKHRKQMGNKCKCRDLRSTNTDMNTDIDMNTHTDTDTDMTHDRSNKTSIRIWQGREGDTENTQNIFFFIYLYL